MTKRNQKGFTLVELMVTIVVLSVGVLAVATMQMTAARGNSFARDLSQAVALGQEQVERIMFWDYADARLNDDGADSSGGDGEAGLGNNPEHPDEAERKEPDESHPDNPIQGDGIVQEYNMYWNVAEDFPINSTKTIRILVTWIDGRGNRSVSLDYAKADIR